MPNKKAKVTGYSYTSLRTYTPVSADALHAHERRMQEQVIPKIKDQVERKETGAQRLRMKGLLDPAE